MKINLRTNEVIDFMGRKNKIVAIKGTHVILQRIEGDFETYKYSLEKLISDSSFKGGTMISRSEEKKYESVLNKLPDPKRDEVSWKYELIRPVLLLNRIKQNDIKALIEFTEKYSKAYLRKNEDLLKLSQEELIDRIRKKGKDSGRKFDRSTFMRYLKAYRDGLKQGIPVAVECFVKAADIDYIKRKDTYAIEICSPRHPDVVVDVIYTKYPEEYHPIIKKTIEKDFLNLRRLKTSAIFRILEAECVKKELKIIPEITVRSLLKQLSDRTIAIYRDGRKGIEQFSTVQRGYSETAALYPLHMVQIDHTDLDIIVIDEKTGLAIGRPILTLGIDVFTRMIWCMHLSFDEPSANKVRKAIEHGIFPKEARSRFQTTNEWGIFGIPTIIYLDNGSDFTSHAVKRMINETLESEVRYRPRGTPRYGGVIERMMGSINTMLIHSLPGSTGSNIKDKGERDPVKEAKLTLTELEQIITKFIVDVYHNDEHKGLPDDCKVPVLMYENGVEQHGNPPMIAPHLKVYYHIELLPTELKPYASRDGITMDHIHYKADHLAYLVNKREVKYKVKYDDDDLSHIYIQLPDSSEYVEVLASYPSPDELKGVNRYTWLKIKDIIRKQGEQKRLNKLDAGQIKQAKVELQTMIASTYTKKMTVRKMTERIGAKIDVSLNNYSQNTSLDNLDDLLLGAKAILSERDEGK